MVLQAREPTYLINETITSIPAELVSYDKFQPDFNVENGFRYHSLSPCGSCGRVRMVHVNYLLDRGQKIYNLELTPRETELLGLLVREGLTIQQAAKKMFLAETTVKAHKSSLYRKLDVHSRVQLYGKAREIGLVQ